MPDISDDLLRDTADPETTPPGSGVDRDEALAARAGVPPLRDALDRLELELDDTARLGRAPDDSDDEGLDRELDPEDPPLDEPPEVDPPELDPPDDAELVAVLRGTA